MRIDIITLFPELFGPHLALGVTRRAFSPQGIDVRLWPLRDHAEGAYRRVDDRPFGGGPGMVMMAEPLQRAFDALCADRGEVPPLIHFTPTGERLTQAAVRALAAGPGAALLCGRYEGVDQRFIDRHVTMELSLGDYVLSGGELPALVLLDAMARLQPGVMPAGSHEQDSFSDGLLEGPCYTRPELWPAGEGGKPVPEVLLSGHHAAIAAWRRQQSLGLTARRRPELIEQARRQGALSAEDERYLRSLGL
ncbi:MAG: tRNA (guanosine(37)-N1)-methyltransferase TrmD [Rubrivivax sp.]|nr:tRNA (guanosine(37)-N1)-methyltransferase TrmD [Rubrivivax sp.]